MTDTNSNLNETEIKRFLYGEMTDAERDRLEEKFFDDDELFFAVVNLENELVDLYARGKFPADELLRFEHSLKKLPERRVKAANAAALQTFIAEGRSEERSEKRSEEKPIAVNQTFGQKLAEFFTIKTPAFGYAMAGLLFLLAVSSIFLLIDGGRKGEELASLQTERQGNQVVSQQKQSELENQLANSQKQEADLKTQIDGERETSSDLTDELERERQKREQIENELERLRRESSAARPSPTPQPPAPIIASILLTPIIATRGGNLEAKKISVAPETKRIAVRLSLPADVKTDERFSVWLNDKNITQNLAARLNTSGQKTIQLMISPKDLLDGLNKLSVTDAAGKEISKYNFVARKL